MQRKGTLGTVTADAQGDFHVIWKETGKAVAGKVPMTTKYMALSSRHESRVLVTDTLPEPMVAPYEATYDHAGDHSGATMGSSRRPGDWSPFTLGARE